MSDGRARKPWWLWASVAAGAFGLVTLTAVITAIVTGADIEWGAQQLGSVAEWVAALGTLLAVFGVAVAWSGELRASKAVKEAENRRLEDDLRRARERRAEQASKVWVTVARTDDSGKPVTVLTVHNGGEAPIYEIQFAIPDAPRSESPVLIADLAVPGTTDFPLNGVSAQGIDLGDALSGELLKPGRIAIHFLDSQGRLWEQTTHGRLRLVDASQAVEHQLND